MPEAGWECDLAAKIQAKADTLVTKEVTTETTVSEREVIEANKCILLVPFHYFYQHRRLLALCKLTISLSESTLYARPLNGALLGIAPNRERGDWAYLLCAD